MALVAGDDRHAHEVGEVARDAVGVLGDADAALLGERLRVEKVDLLLAVAGEDTLERGEREQARVALGDPPEELDLDALDRGRDHGREPAEAGDERDERAQELHVLGRDRGDVHGVETTPPVRAATTCSAVFAGAVLRLGRRRAEVRRHNHIG